MTFVGRGLELASLDAQVGEGRVVTVTGPAGVGKTRLVRRWLEVEGRARSAWGSGPIFCALRDCQTLAEVCASIACATGATVGAGDEPEELVGTILAARGPAFVILDGLGTSSPPLGPAIARWIAVAPRAQIVATASAPLGIREESPLPLGPLPVGEGAARSDAERLLLLRARELRDRDLDDEGLADSGVRLVRALGGVPLAIELAAARCDLLVLGDLERAVRARLAAGLDPLAAMIEVSTEVLPPVLRDALAQCAVFRGGFEVRAAEAVLDLGAGPDEPRAVDVLQALRDVSLLQAALEGPGSRVRLSLHGAVLAWAEARLAASGQRARFEERHAAHHLLRARLACARLEERTDDDAALDCLSDERENLLAVHRRGLADPEARGAWCLEAAALLDPLLQAQGPWALRESLLDEALHAAGEGAEPGLGARAKLCRGLARVYRNRPAEALLDLEAAAASAQALGDGVLEGAALSAAGMTLSLRLRRPAEAVPLLQRAITLLGRAPGQEGLARSRLGWAQYHEGRVPDAVASFEAALTSFRGVGDRRREALALADRAIVAHDHGRIEEARLSYEQALAVLRGMGEQPDQVRVMGFLGLVAAEQGRHEAAVVLLDQGIRLAGRMGHPWAEATWIGYRGLAREVAGDGGSARAGYERALTLHRHLGNAKQEGLMLALRAGLDAAEGRADVARSALEEARAILEHMGEPALAKVPHLCEARLQNALARAAEERGDAAAAARHRDASRRNADAVGQDLGVLSVELRLLAALCARDPRPCANANGDVAGLEIAEGGHWFRAPGGEIVHLGGRRAPRLVLARLARLRVDAPGTAASIGDVLDAGWPGNDGHLTAREERVYTTLWTLRRLGLGPFLTSRDDGVLIDPQIPLTIVSDPAS